MSPQVRRFLVAAIIAVIYLLAPGAVPASVARSALACDFDTELNRTLDELGEDGARWHVGSPLMVGDYEASGYVNPTTRHAHVNRSTKCENVSSVVHHEWMHLQQMDLYGGDYRGTAGGDARGELVADCGSMLLGSTYTPYIGMWEGGCGEYELAEARRLIAHREPTEKNGASS